MGDRQRATPASGVLIALLQATMLWSPASVVAQSAVDSGGDGEPASRSAPSAVSRIAARIEIGAGTMLSQHQRNVLGYTNGSYHGTARLGYRIVEPLAVQISFGYWAFPSELGRGSVAPFSFGFRIEPRVGEVGRVFLDSNLSPGRTGNLVRLTVDFGLGFEFAAAPWLDLGPVFRYAHVVQPETQEAPADAKYWAAGLSLTFHGPRESRPESSPPPEPTAEAPRRLARLDGERIHIEEQIHFAVDSDRIVGASSYHVLDDVAAVLTDHPAIHHLRIEGHTDDVASDSYNLRLSERRAAAVRTYLIEQGIAPRRLSSIGRGERVPLCMEITNDCRALNRRVELRITQGMIRTRGEVR